MGATSRTPVLLRVHRARAPRWRIGLSSFAGLYAIAALALAVFNIARDDWGNWVQMAWLEPGASFVSAEFALFLITGAVFVAGGVFSLVRPEISLLLTGSGFFVALACLDICAPGSWDGESVMAALFFFVIPGVWFLLGSRQAARSVSW